MCREGSPRLLLWLFTKNLCCITLSFLANPTHLPVLFSGRQQAVHVRRMRGPVWGVQIPSPAQGDVREKSSTEGGAYSSGRVRPLQRPVCTARYDLRLVQSYDARLCRGGRALLSPVQSYLQVVIHIFSGKNCSEERQARTRCGGDGGGCGECVRGWRTVRVVRGS